MNSDERHGVECLSAFFEASSVGDWPQVWLEGCNPNPTKSASAASAAGARIENTC